MAKFGRIARGRYFLEERAFGPDPINSDIDILGELENEIIECKPTEIHIPEHKGPGFWEYLKDVLIGILLIKSRDHGYKMFFNDYWYDRNTRLFGDDIKGSSKDGYYM